MDTVTLQIIGFTVTHGRRVELIYNQRAKLTRATVCRETCDMTIILFLSTRQQHSHTHINVCQRVLINSSIHPYKSYADRQTDTDRQTLRERAQQWYMADWQGQLGYRQERHNFLRRQNIKQQAIHNKPFTMTSKLTFYEITFPTLITPEWMHFECGHHREHVPLSH